MCHYQPWTAPCTNHSMLARHVHVHHFLRNFWVFRELQSRSSIWLAKEDQKCKTRDAAWKQEDSQRISWSHLLITGTDSNYSIVLIRSFILLYSAECHGASAYLRLRRVLVSGQVVKVPDKVLGTIRGTFRFAFPSMTKVFEWPLVTPSCPKRWNRFKPNVMSSKIPTR